MPPVPLTLPAAIRPLPNTQFVQVLLVIANVPVGADGAVHVPGTVVPTVALWLLHPPVVKTLAFIIWAGPS